MATEVQLFRIKTQKHGSGGHWTRTETVQILRDTPNDANFFVRSIEKKNFQDFLTDRSTPGVCIIAV